MPSQPITHLAVAGRDAHRPPLTGGGCRGIGTRRTSADVNAVLVVVSTTHLFPTTARREVIIQERHAERLFQRNRSRELAA